MTNIKIKNSLKKILLLVMVLPLSGCDGFLSNFQDMTQFLIRLQQQYDSFLSFFIAFAYLSGALFCMKALFKFKEHGTQSGMMMQQHSLRAPLTYLIVGMCLLFLPKMIALTTNAVFMTSTVILSYPGQTLDAFDTVKSAVYGLVQLIGLIAVIRALFIIGDSHNGGHQGGISKALVHLAGGIIALNIAQFMQIMNNEFT